MKNGIDYGGGLTNVDHETGIRYGVTPKAHLDISLYCDDFEPVYATLETEVICDNCGTSWIVKEGEDDFSCECGETLGVDEDSFEDDCSEPIGTKYIGGGGYELDEDESDIWILKSKYWTYAPYCSPCAPGACYIDPDAYDGTEEEFAELLRSDFSKAYCLGHEYFSDGAPYPVWEVGTDKLVKYVSPEEERKAALLKFSPPIHDALLIRWDFNTDTAWWRSSQLRTDAMGIQGFDFYKCSGGGLVLNQFFGWSANATEGFWE